MVDMVITGIVREDGIIESREKIDLPPGQKVTLLVHPETETYDRLTKLLIEIGGSDTGLPKDYANEIDHYWYGTPKRED